MITLTGQLSITVNTNTFVSLDVIDSNGGAVRIILNPQELIELRNKLKLASHRGQ